VNYYNLDKPFKAIFYADHMHDLSYKPTGTISFVWSVWQDFENLIEREIREGEA